MIGSAPSTASAHPAFAEVADALRQIRVRWALLRLPNGGLSAPTGDIDLLVHPDDLDAATRALKWLAFVRMPRPGRDVHLLRYLDTCDRWLWLHLTTTLRCGSPHPLAIGADGWCLAPRLYEHGIPRLATDVEFWTLLWHCLADKRHVAPHHRDALRSASVAARCDSVAARAFASSCGDPNMNARLLDAVIHDDWRSVESWGRGCHSVQARFPRRVVASISRRLSAIRQWRARRGLSVAVLGPDGAGKSTVIAGIASSVPFQSCTVYMGLTGGALRHVRRLRVPVLVFVASACIVWFRYLRAYAHMARGRLVLFDRYVYDAVAPPGYTLGRFEGIGRRLSGYLCPSPDLVILLDAPGAVMYARKQSYDAARLEMWRQCFLSLTTRLRSLEVIDATQPPPHVRRDAVAAIWRRYIEHWDVVAQPHAETRS